MKTKDLEYWKNNCEEDYLHTPISVLRYIKELEEAINYAHSSTQLNEKYTPEFEEWLQYQQKDIKFDKYILNDTYLSKEQMFEYWESDKNNL